MVRLKTALKWVLLAGVVSLFGVAACAQNIGGKWCAQGNPSDCLIITVSKTSPEVVTAQFQENGQVYAEAMGYFRDGRLVLAFRRTNKKDLGYVTFHLRSDGGADAATFNPDGTQRWKGVYVKTEAHP